MKYRVGKKVGRTIYRDDELIGVMDTIDLARFFVSAANRADEWLTGTLRERGFQSLDLEPQDEATRGEATPPKVKVIEEFRFTVTGKDYTEVHFRAISKLTRYVGIEALQLLEVSIDHSPELVTGLGEVITWQGEVWARPKDDEMRCDGSRVDYLPVLED